MNAIRQLVTQISKSALANSVQCRRSVCSIQPTVPTTASKSTEQNARESCGIDPLEVDEVSGSKHIQQPATEPIQKVLVEHVNAPKCETFPNKVQEEAKESVKMTTSKHVELPAKTQPCVEKMPSATEMLEPTVPTTASKSTKQNAREHCGIDPLEVDVSGSKHIQQPATEPIYCVFVEHVNAPKGETCPDKVQEKAKEPVQMTTSQHVELPAKTQPCTRPCAEKMPSATEIPVERQLCGGKRNEIFKQVVNDTIFKNRQVDSIPCGSQQAQKTSIDQQAQNTSMTVNGSSKWQKLVAAAILGVLTCWTFIEYAKFRDSEKGNKPNKNNGDN